MLVAAPTGSGKTVVGEFAVHLALETGRKAFYTTPIKALSNQKYHDLVARYGADKVGLLTGDNVVNGEAPVVVMTTEVLRNMLYAGSRTLLGLGFVVMDEVHYLADRMRGAVWEEVIIHLPGVGDPGVALGDGLQRRGVRRVAGHRPRRDDHDRRGEAAGAALPARHGRPPAARPLRLLRRRRGRRLRQGGRAGQRRADRGSPATTGPARAMRDRRTPRKGAGTPENPRPVGNGRRVWIPSRVDVVERLDREGLLPAIVFIFSRVGCDAAVTQCLHAGHPADHARGARRDLRVRRGALPRTCREEDLHVLGYHEFLDGLTRGVAAHHAGMLPAFKQCVEELSSAGSARSSSPPRPWRSASTCPPARS